MPRVFQSSPTPEGGRYFDAFVVGFLEQLVSILAHPGGRALPPARAGRERKFRGFNPRPPRRAGATRAVRRTVRRTGCFNPRPPRRAGATINQRGDRRRRDVSILAHPGGRALHCCCRCLPSFTKNDGLREPAGRSVPVGLKTAFSVRDTNIFNMLNSTRNPANFMAAGGSRIFPIIAGHQTTSGASKSVALKLPYSLTCNSTGSVRR